MTPSAGEAAHTYRNYEFEDLVKSRESGRHSKKVAQSVTPAKAGVQKSLIFLDSGFRRNDKKHRYLTFAKPSNLIC